MPRSVASAVLIVLLLLSSAQARTRTGSDAPLLFGGDADYAPFEYLDEGGEPRGFSIDILRTVAEAVHMETEVRLGDWEEVRSDLETGRIDALIGMRYSRARDALLDFSEPYLINTSTIFVRKGSDIRTVDDLRNKEVIVQRGDIMDDYLHRSGLTSRIVYVTNQIVALRLLASGKYDAALLTRLSGLYQIERLGLENLTTTGGELAQGRYGFAVAEGNAPLLERLNEGLRILKATGRYEEIYERWFGLYERQSLWSQMLRYAAWILSPILILLTVALIWSWTLRRQVEAKTRQLAGAMAERQRAEAALEAEKNFRQLVEASPVPMMLVDRTGAILHINLKFTDLFGRSDQTDLRAWWSDTCPDTPLPIDPEKPIETGISQEVTITCRDGERHYIDCRFSSIEGRYILVFNDITDRKRAEDALEYRAGMDELISVITTRFVNLASEEVDREIDRALEDLGRHIDVDRSYVFLFSEDGRTMENTHEWCAPGIEPQMENLRRLPIDALPWFMERLDEQEVFHCPSVPALGPEAQLEKEEWQREGIQSLIVVSMLLKGRKVGFVGFDSVRREQEWPEAVPFLLRTVGESFANALERRRVENALRSAHQQLLDIIDFLPDATFVIDKEGKVVAWNRAIEAMTGVPKEEMIGRGDHAYAVPLYGKRRPLLIDLVDRPREEIERFYSVVGGGDEGQPLFVEHFHPILNQGRGAHVWATASPLFDRQGNIVGAIESIRDISDRIEARKKLEASHREMEAFVYTVSHDLRSPLTPIIGYADYLRQAYGKCLDSQAREYLGAIGASGRKMIDLMEDLLTLASLGKLKTPEEPVDTGAVVRETVGNLAGTIDDAGLKVIAGKLPSLRVPKTILTQIFANLVGNAVRYAGRDGGPIEIGGERSAEMVRLHVRDHGPGIEEAERERIFEAFHRGETGRKSAGTGIGLAVVAKSARLYGGRAWVEETPGGGATFVVELSDAPPEST